MESAQNSSSKIPEPPKGWSALLWRLPIWIYRLRPGWLLGHRALLVTHTGRVSGLARQAVLEVIRYDKDTNTHYVASGFGEKANWYKNILQTPHVTIRVAGKEINALAERLSFSEAQNTFKAYHQRHPKALQGLAKLIGYQVSENVAEILDFFSHNIPVIAFHPIDPSKS